MTVYRIHDMQFIVLFLPCLVYITDKIMYLKTMLISLLKLYFGVDLKQRTFPFEFDKIIEIQNLIISLNWGTEKTKRKCFVKRKAVIN